MLGWILAWAFGAYRKHSARKALIGTVTAAGSDHLADVLVPDGMGGFFHLDFVLLTPRAILVIDLRDVSGNIFGGDQMTEWTVMDGPQRFTFTNPQGALYDRIAAVRAIAGEVPVEGRIVFTRRGKFPKGLPKWTLMVDSLQSEFPTVERAELAGTLSRAMAAAARFGVASGDEPGQAPVGALIAAAQRARRGVVLPAPVRRTP